MSRTIILGVNPATGSKAFFYCKLDLPKDLNRGSEGKTQKEHSQMNARRVSSILMALLLMCIAAMAQPSTQSPTLMLDTGFAPQITPLCGKNGASSAVFVDAIAHDENGNQAILARYLDPSSGSSQVHFSVFTKDACIVTDGMIGSSGRFILAIVPNSLVYRGAVVAYEAVYADSQYAAMAGNVKRGVFAGCDLKYQIDDHPQSAPQPQAKPMYSTPDFSVSADGRIIMKAPVSKAPSFQLPPIPQGSAPPQNPGWRYFTK